jgi:hypothetical protein
VGDARHFYFSTLVINGVDHAVVTDADAPQVPSAMSFLQPLGLGSVASALIFGKMRLDKGSGSRKNSFSALDLRATRYSGTQFASCPRKCTIRTGRPSLAIHLILKEGMMKTATALAPVG